MSVFYFEKDQRSRADLIDLGRVCLATGDSYWMVFPLKPNEQELGRAVLEGSAQYR